MKSNNRSRMYVILLAALVLASCASGPDMFIAKEVSAVDKADFLFKQGVAQYEDLLMDKNDLKSIPRVRKFFENALLADPLHPQAQSWIEKVDAFGSKRYAGYIETAQKLLAKGKRTKAEDYEMVLAVKKAGDIKSSDKELSKLRSDTAGVRKEIIQGRVAKISDAQTKILAQSNPKTLSKLVPVAGSLMAEIETIDPGNGDVKKAQAAIGGHITALAQKDIDTARESLENRKYGDAEAAIVRADKIVSGFDPGTDGEIKALKYQLYLRWGNALYGLNKFSLADQKAAKALSISRTTEAVSLKAKINKATAAKVQDYDADIQDVLGEIDSLIAQGELVKAWGQVDANVALMKKKANKDQLEAKRDAIVEALKPMYNDGIAAYNEEDYELARDKFTVVTKIKPDYEQAQAYLDRTNGKLKALSGAN